MNMNEALISELQSEAANTRKMLALIPTDKFDYKPHEKSMLMGRLATHIAELPGWIALAIGTDGADLANNELKSPQISTTEELVKFHEDSVAKAKTALESATNEDLFKNWSLRSGDHVIFNMPKVAVIRSMAKNHMIHHRGQLSVYMRMNDIPLPSVYGPTADEK